MKEKQRERERERESRKRVREEEDREKKEEKNCYTHLFTSDEMKERQNSFLLVHVSKGRTSNRREPVEELKKRKE